MFSSVRSRRFINRLFEVLAAVAFVIALIPLLSILYQTISQGYVVLNRDFFTQITPPIGGSGGGIVNAIEGSLVIVAIASLIGIPIGLLTGAYLSEYPGRLANNVRLIAEVLTGVPSMQRVKPTPKSLVSSNLLLVFWSVHPLLVTIQ